MSKIRLGLTMRIARQPYPNRQAEERDALAHDWHRFMAQVLPDVFWLPIPNLEEKTVQWVEELDLTGLIFTGGDNFGSIPRRDRTEKYLLEWARQKNMPVLGVCRGAQALQILTGGKLSPITEHVATRHPICAVDGKASFEVNSYHALGIEKENLSDGFRPKYLTSDGLWVEAFTHKFLPWNGLLWHPEREANPLEHDRKLVTKMFLENS